MYKRFLINNDYLSIVTEEALSQLIRGRENRLAQAEEAAEETIIEYLIDSYLIEETLAIGKNLVPYNKNITYPPGGHFKYNDSIYVAIRPIAGRKAPTAKVYWEVYEEQITDDTIVRPYSQLDDFEPGDIVLYSGIYYICREYNGYAFNDIRIPGIQAWDEVETEAWEANVENELWAVKSYNGKFYALISLDNIDLTVNPYESDNWGLIGDYAPDHDYDLSGHDYAVAEGKVFVPAMNVNCDTITEAVNIKEHDPRNPNIKKHLVRLAIYELHKLISPNNISQARITDYETSLVWLRDAGRLKINPKIPRRLDESNRPEPEYAIATFARDYDPNNNPWQI